MAVDDGARQRGQPVLDVVDDDARQVVDRAGGQRGHGAEPGGGGDELVAVRCSPTRAT